MQDYNPRNTIYVIPLALRHHAAYIVHVKKKSRAEVARVPFLNVNSLIKYIDEFKLAFTDLNEEAEQSARA